MDIISYALAKGGIPKAVSDFLSEHLTNPTNTTRIRNSSGTVPYCSDDTHPSASGFYQIADSYYACIKAN